MVGAGSDAARQRREGTIILAMINHPELISSHLDTLCELELDVPELDSMRRQIIDIAALHEGLDGRRLRDHLSARGYGAAIVRIEAQASRLNSWFVLPDAALADAETGLSQMLALYRKTVTLERELKIAERVLAEDTTEGISAASMTFAKSYVRRSGPRSRSKASGQPPGGFRGLSHSLTDRGGDHRR